MARFYPVMEAANVITLVLYDYHITSTADPIYQRLKHIITELSSGLLPGAFLVNGFPFLYISHNGYLAEVSTALQTNVELKRYEPAERYFKFQKGKDARWQGIGDRMDRI